MSNPFLGEIRIVSFNFPPKGWAFCNGQLLPINQNQPLFAIMGTTYGGDGRVNFALPDLRGRSPFHMGSGHTLGERGGEENHTLTLNEMPTHIHTLGASTATANQVGGPSGNTPAASSANPYETALGNAGGAMAPGAISNVGGSQPHLNLSPYLCLYFIVALQGIFPSQN